MGKPSKESSVLLEKGKESLEDIVGSGGHMWGKVPEGLPEVVAWGNGLCYKQPMLDTRDLDRTRGFLLTFLA